MGGDGVSSYYRAKTAELEVRVAENTQNLRRLEAQRNELNSKGTARTGAEKYTRARTLEDAARKRACADGHDDAIRMTNARIESGIQRVERALRDKRERRGKSASARYEKERGRAMCAGTFPATACATPGVDVCAGMGRRRAGLNCGLSCGGAAEELQRSAALCFLRR